jgi:hypothetical protein
MSRGQAGSSVYGLVPNVIVIDAGWDVLPRRVHQSSDAEGGRPWHGLAERVKAFDCSRLSA